MKQSPFRRIRQKLFLLRPEKKGSMLHKSFARQAAGYVIPGKLLRYLGFPLIGHCGSLLCFSSLFLPALPA